MWFWLLLYMINRHGLYRESQVSQNYTVSPCLRKLGCGWCLSQYYSSYLKGDALQDKGQVARNAPGRNLMH